jgi:hypothetical protein
MIVINNKSFAYRRSSMDGSWQVAIKAACSSCVSLFLAAMPICMAKSAMENPWMFPYQHLK